MPVSSGRQKGGEDTMFRRTFMALALAAAMPLGVQAQDYPSKDIRIICTFPAGSGADILVRFMTEKIKAQVPGATIIVENKPGAAGSIGTQYVARSAADGHTILMDAGTTIASIMSRFKQPPIDVAKDLQMVATINRQAFMIVVDAKSDIKTLEQLTERLKAEGDKASYAAAANSGMVLGELYKQAAKLETVQVKYESAPASLNDLLSGRLLFGALDPVFSLAQQREGRLRVLAVASGERLASIPDIPTLKEKGFPIDVTTWFSAAVPAATPKPVVDKINSWFTTALKQPETIKFLNDSGGDPWANSPATTQQMLIKAIDDWREFIRIANIPPAG
jgi:tripartite-type tricarboxylate transporter receptor subunit TctC